MKARLLLIGLSIFILFTGCSKEGGSSGEKISRIYGGNQLQGEYTYNSEGRQVKYVGYFAGATKLSEISFYYDPVGKLIKKESAFNFSSSTTGPQWSNSYTEYSYDVNGRISEEKNYLVQNNTGVLVSKAKPAYDASGKLISRTLLLPTDIPVKLTKYQYNNGNISLQEDYQYNGSNPELHFKTSYDDFDNKLNPYQNLPSAVPPFSVNRNNILQATVTNYILSPGTPVITINKSVYSSYNRGGLPIKVSENGSEFTYEYKK